MIAAALKVEADDYVAHFTEERDGHGCALVVRNGSVLSRPVTTGTGTFELKALRVNDKRVVDGIDGQALIPLVRAGVRFVDGKQPDATMRKSRSKSRRRPERSP